MVWYARAWGKNNNSKTLRFKAIIEKSTNLSASVVPGKNMIENDLTGIRRVHEIVARPLLHLSKGFLVFPGILRKKSTNKVLLM